MLNYQKILLFSDDDDKALSPFIFIFPEMVSKGR